VVSNPPAESLLQFPTDYPIKVVARTCTDLRPCIDAIVRQHCPNLKDEQIMERSSKAANFTALTYHIVADSREQVTSLVNALVDAEGVLMVI